MSVHPSLHPTIYAALRLSISRFKGFFFAYLVWCESGQKSESFPTTLLLIPTHDTAHYHPHCCPCLPAILSTYQLCIRPWLFFSRVHATLQPALSVGRLVGPSVTLDFYLWFYYFDLPAPAQMVWWPQIWPLPTRTRLRLPCIRPCL